MAKVKASDIIMVKKMLQDAGLDQQVLPTLSAETFKALQAAGATSWVEMSQEAEVLQAAAAALYAQDPRALERLGREVAKQQFTGIYKVFLMIPSVDFIVKRISTMWKTIYTAG